MARTIKNFEFPYKRGRKPNPESNRIRTGERRGGKYPWDKWLDGQTWRAYAGKDYDCTSRSFVTAVLTEAANRSLAPRTTIGRDKDGKEHVTFKAEPTDIYDLV